MSKNFNDNFLFNTVGFEDFFEHMSKNTKKVFDNYPPYNIKKISEDKYEIEMAVAGFGKSDIEIEMVGDKLTIAGSVESDTEEGVEYYHRGLADRKFKRQFTIADKVEVRGAELINGILRIGLDAQERFQKSLIKIK